MNLLPKKSGDFADPTYWKNFFAKRDTPFEWYGGYSDLGEYIEQHIKRQDTILQLGCGNSTLASDLYDVGYKNIHSIDTDDRVIEQQKMKNRERSSLTFAKDDATSLSASNESYTACVDKGTLDALLPPSASLEQEALVRNMFKEVDRVLKPNGRYVIITLAQPHLLKLWTEHFKEGNRYIMRVYEFPTTVCSFPMPVFFFVASKLPKEMPFAMPMELWRAKYSNPERFKDNSGLLDAVCAQQELSRFVHHCSNKLTSDVYINLNGKTGPRYMIRICDDPNVKEIKTLTAFVVPIGRDHEWIFVSDRGRQEVRKQVNKDRVLFVYLYRDNTYDSMEAVKDELANFVCRFRPKDHNVQIEFVTMGDTDVSTRVASGSSDINGDWVVEDVNIGNDVYRRLVFLNSQNLIQSEAVMKKGKKGKLVIDLDTLTCDHHNQMLCALSLMNPNPLESVNTAELNFAVLGLGGGLLTTFLLRNFPQSKVTGVDLDPAVVKVAKEQFSLPHSDKRLTVKVGDAIEYLQEISDNSTPDKLDVLFVDVAGAMHDDGLSCPPACFLEENVLENMKKSLKPDGLLALNVVTRDLVKLESIRRKLLESFPCLYSLQFDIDVNQVLIGFKSERSINLKGIVKNLPNNLSWVQDLAQSILKMKQVV